MLGSPLNMDGGQQLLLFCCTLKSEEAPTKYVQTVVAHKIKNNESVNYIKLNKDSFI